MNTRYTHQAVALALVATCMPAFAQSPARPAVEATPWKPALLSDGQPNVQGTWTAVYYGMGCLTNPTNGDVNCVPPPGPRPAAGTANAGGPPSVDPTTGKAPGQRGNGNPPSIVNAQPDGNRAGGGRQRPATGTAAAYTDDAPPPAAARAPRSRNAPSRIIDTPNYDIPYTPEALAHQQDLFAHYYEFARYGDIDPQQRCWPLGAVRQFTWHDVKLEQYPGYVVLIFAGAEVYRIIYLDNRPHIGNGLKLWMGDSRGHWEGTTLVVDTTSNNAKGRLSRAGDFSSDKVHYTERFKFTSLNTLRYEATFDDPSVYTRPWTFAVDEKRGFFGGDGGVPNGAVTQESQAKFELWEEACQEGLIPGGNDVPGLPTIPAEYTNR
ncbi:hypothetical protein SAMN05421770_104164 [Granulicella rosea]|uniref:Uncharacterized protein n=1 Tax=Granulicella rosea TaxID=474952 RepID=A0A239JYW2_9BACT|nr:hypothetical protein [Granulicella rosea]SNT10044.1 hypothetical protein SAMN05421770_104164 [Granulicella rosea]